MTSKTYKIDKLDKRIINCLQEDGRKSNILIARELGVTESTIRRRINQLLSGEVMRITAVANPLKLDRPIVVIIAINVTPSRLLDVAKSLNLLTEFRFIGMTTGEYDFVTEVWFQSFEELHRFLVERLTPIEGITRVVTTNVIEMVRYTYDWGRGPLG